MATIDAAITAFYTDMQHQGLINQTTLLEFSEFGRRVAENGTQGTDHGEGGMMLPSAAASAAASTAPRPTCNPFPGNPTLSSGGGDVRWDIDFRRVYAEVLDKWLGSNSTAVLGGAYPHVGFIT